MGNTVLLENEDFIFSHLDPFNKEVKIFVLLKDSLVCLRAISNTPGSSKNFFKFVFKESRCH